MAEEAFLDALIDWINRKLIPPGMSVESDTPLFKGGLIDSIRILELIAWTEREAGIVIPDRMIRMDYFTTPRKIAETFANGVDHVGR